MPQAESRGHRQAAHVSLGEFVSLAQGGQGLSSDRGAGGVGGTGRNTISSHSHPCGPQVPEAGEGGEGAGALRADSQVFLAPPKGELQEVTGLLLWAL